MLHNHHTYRWCILALLLIGLVIPASGTVHADEFGYQVRQATHAANAGGTSSARSFTLRGTLGQASVASSQSGPRSASGGIWTGFTAADILVLEKTFRDTLPPAEADDELVFVVAITNNGYRAQTNVVVTDTLPPGLTLVPDSAEANLKGGDVHAAVSGDTVTMEIPQLSYEQIAVLTYRATVSADAEGQVITNTASATSDTHSPIEASAVVHVVRPYRVYLPLTTRNFSPHSPTPTPEAHELDDAPDQCPGYDVLIDDHLYRDDWDFENDNDWYTFQAEAGQTYTIQTEDLEEQADTLLFLYDAGCATVLAENDDISWPANVASRVVWTAPEAGTYCVMIRSYDWEVFGTDTGYTFQVSTGVVEQPGASVAAGDDAPPKPAPPPTPMPDTSRREDRGPGLAAPLPQKGTPPPTPEKPPAQPTPGGPSNPTPAPTPVPTSAPSQPNPAPAENPPPVQPTPPSPLLPDTGGQADVPLLPFIGLVLVLVVSIAWAEARKDELNSID